MCTAQHKNYVLMEPALTLVGMGRKVAIVELIKYFAMNTHFVKLARVFVHPVVRIITNRTALAG